MSEKANDAITKLDESFGTLTPRTNTDAEASVTGSSEDDKKSPLADYTTLTHTQPSTNDAPGQEVNTVPTEAQNDESKAIEAADKAAVAQEVQDKLNHWSFTPDEENNYEADAQEDPVGSVLEPVMDKIEGIKYELEADPVKVLTDAAKTALIVIGGFTVLKALFGHKK